MSLIAIDYYPNKREPLKNLEPSFHAMGDVLSKYTSFFSNVSPGEVSYYYNERATISQFVGGVWRSNSENFVLEEYKSEKVAGEDKYSGRDDLWFKAEDATYYAEAKQCDLQLTKPNQSKAAILSQACAECEKAHSNSTDARVNKWVTYPIGMSFCYLWSDETLRNSFEDNLRTFEQQLKLEVSRLASQQPYDFIIASYYNPELLKPEQVCVWKGNRRIFPALITAVCIRNDVTYS